MLSLILASAAASLSLPSVFEAISTSDYPEWALRSEASAAATVRFVIDPGGKEVKCTTLNTFGDTRLANEICTILKRKRLPSATSRDGARVQVVGEQLIQLFLPDSREGRQIMTLSQASDAELSVDELPGGKPAEVRIILHFDRNGKVVDCGPESPKQTADLISAACGQKTLFDGAVEHDVAGQAVPYLTKRKVRFVIAAPSASKPN